MPLLIQNGINWIIDIQSLGNWLHLPMLFFTALGNENFFFLVFPLLYWCLDPGLGLRLAFILAASNYLSFTLKLLFAGPRPYWVSTEVKPFLHEDSFGIPSGHALNSTVGSGVLAARLSRPWAWVLAFVLTFFISFSRLYLGVHFVHDVIAGWVIGYLLLSLFMRFWDPIAAWLKTKTLFQQIMIAFLTSMLMIAIGAWATARLDGYVFPAEWVENARRVGPIPDPVSTEEPFTAAGSFFGLATGVAWLASRGGFHASGSLQQRALRYVIGLFGIIILWLGLGHVFPDGENAVSLLLRYLRYLLVGFWVSAGAPWLFFHFKLLRQSKM